MDLSSLVSHAGGFLWIAASFIVALSIIVAVHEFGHYIVGRWSGIQAEVFSLGFGRPIWSRVDRHGTRWQVASLPLGGYVKFLGDANAASAGVDVETMQALSPEERRHTMHGAPLWARAATVVAGPMFNFLLSVAIFSVTFILSGAPAEHPVIGGFYPLPGDSGGLRIGDEILAIDGVATPSWEKLGEVVETLPAQETLDYRVRRDGQEQSVSGPFPLPARVGAVVPGSAAFDAGLQKDDVVLNADGRPLLRFSDLQTVIKAGQGAPVALAVWRAGATLQITLTPRKTDLPTAAGGFETRYLIGLNGDYIFAPITRKVGPLEAVAAAVGQVWYIIKTSVSAISHIATGAISSCNLHGPLGIAEVSGQQATQGVADFIWLIAALSTGIGFMNLFPIPMLDGGHLVFHAYEWATGRPLPDRVANVALMVGLTLVLALMSFGLFNDLRCP